MEAKTKYTEKIKQILIDLAVEDKLPMDLTELNPDVFMPVVKPLVHTILTLREDAEMALSGEWNKSDEGFEAQISLIDEVLN